MAGIFKFELVTPERVLLSENVVQPELLTVLAEKALDVEEIDPDTVAVELEVAQAELEEAKDDEARLAATTAIEQLQTLQGSKAA